MYHFLSISVNRNGVLIRKADREAINVLVLSSRDTGPGYKKWSRGKEVASILGITMHKSDQVRRRSIEDGLEAVWRSRQGQRSRDLSPGRN